MRAWIYKTDEAGKPRRFLGHGEAALWALLTVGKLIGVVVFFTSLNVAFDTYWNGDPWRSGFPIVLAAMWPAIWVSLSLILYLYVSLSGGVMDEEARRRYQNNETVRFR